MCVDTQTHARALTTYLRIQSSKNQHITCFVSLLIMMMMMTAMMMIVINIIFGLVRKISQTFSQYDYFCCFFVLSRSLAVSLYVIDLFNAHYNPYSTQIYLFFL